MVLHYPANLYESIRLSLTTDLVSVLTGWFALVGMGMFLAQKRERAGLALLVSTALYLLLMALNHWETRYYFFLMVVYCGFAVFALGVLFELMRTRVGSGARLAAVLAVALFAAMWSRSFVMAKTDLTGFLANHPFEVVKACEYLRSQGVTGKRVVARKPHLAAICDQEWVFFPAVKSIDELKTWLAQHRTDYLVVSSVELKRRKELAVLRSAETAPPWLEAVWVNEEPPLILYRPRLDAGKTTEQTE